MVENIRIFRLDLNVPVLDSVILVFIQRNWIEEMLTLIVQRLIDLLSSISNNDLNFERFDRCISHSFL